MGEEEIKHTTNYVVCEKTLLVGGREKYKNDKPLKMFIIIKCMATLFPFLPITVLPDEGGAGEKAEHRSGGFLVSL